MFRSRRDVSSGHKLAKYRFHAFASFAPYSSQYIYSGIIPSFLTATHLPYPIIILPVSHEIPANPPRHCSTSPHDGAPSVAATSHQREIPSFWSLRAKRGGDICGWWMEWRLRSYVYSGGSSCDMCMRCHKMKNSERRNQCQGSHEFTPWKQSAITFGRQLEDIEGGVSLSVRTARKVLICNDRPLRHQPAIISACTAMYLGDALQYYSHCPQSD
jgi:hypothetical protein